jgi:hypothetical protein
MMYRMSLLCCCYVVDVEREIAVATSIMIFHCLVPSLRTDVDSIASFDRLLNIASLDGLGYI